MARLLPLLLNVCYRVWYLSRLLRWPLAAALDSHGGLLRSSVDDVGFVREALARRRLLLDNYRLLLWRDGQPEALVRVEDAQVELATALRQAAARRHPLATRQPLHEPRRLLRMVVAR